MPDTSLLDWHCPLCGGYFDHEHPRIPWYDPYPYCRNHVLFFVCKDCFGVETLKELHEIAKAKSELYHKSGGKTACFLQLLQSL